MNPESLDSSIQSALSSLFPPFEATAPIVLSQLFRTIEERYRGDALQCLLDFLIPSKHLLESVQQAACAGYWDVVFRCEGWPLCLHDKTVIQLAPVNPLLLRPGDFYLQVEPFGDQAARIVLKSLLEEGCREVEETPIPETSYPCIFTEEWLQEINDGRHGTPLSRCLLCTDQGVIKMPWDKIALPEFLDKPKAIPTLSPAFHEAPSEPARFSNPSHFNSSTLPLEMVLPAKERMSASLRHSNYSSRVVKSVRKSKPLIKPVGWVSPNTWDTRNDKEIEGDYVDLVEIEKGKEFRNKRDNHLHHSGSGLFIPVRAAPSIPGATHCLTSCEQTLQYSEEPCVPCGQIGMGPEPTDQDLKCRYRESYLAALKNPVPFEKGTVDLLSALDEVSCCEEGEVNSIGTSDHPKDVLEMSLNHCKRPVTGRELCQFRQFCEPATVKFACHLKDLTKNSENVALKTMSEFTDTLQDQANQVLSQSEVDARGTSDVLSDTSEGDVKLHQKVEVVKPSGKQKAKIRSLSTVSETPKGSPLLCKPHTRSHSDIYPEMINSVMHCKRGDLMDHVTPKQERQKSPQNDSQSRSEIQTSTTSLPLVQPDSVNPDTSAQTEESNLRNIRRLLELGIICLPGSRDRTGRAVVEVHGDQKEWSSPLISAQSVCKLLLYLHTIPRKDVRELGMTLVINARKKPPPPCLYKALLMAQEQALHAVHSIVVFVDKDTNPRPEKQTGLQMDVVTSVKALSKTVELSQLTFDLGGTFTYSHTDWLQFHQRLVSFMSDLKGADILLQRAIKKVEGIKKLDAAQDVQQCIDEQKALMRVVLKDARLVMLQREGGSVLARVRREEYRFPQSEDYRDALDAATGLYNQVEESLHGLVMRSNKSLQHLEFLFTLRETEANISETGTWFNTEGEQILKDSFKTDTLAATEQASQHFKEFLTQAKEKQEYSSKLVTKAEESLDRTRESSPATDIFRTLVNTFKSNMNDFMLRAEKRQKEMETSLHVYRFCDRASSLAKECSHFLEQEEQGCSSVQSSLSTLQMFEERLGGEFSTSHFQALKTKACALGSGGSGLMKVWNAAWHECQKVKQRLDEMQKKKKKCLNKIDKKQATSAEQRANAAGMENRREGSEAGENDQQTASFKELVSNADGAKENITSVSSNLPLKPEFEGSNHSKPLGESGNSAVQNGSCHTKCKPREHHSEEDLRTVDSNERRAFPPHKALGRSLSEGSKVSSHLTPIPNFKPLNVQHKHCQDRTQPLEQDLTSSQKLPVPCDETVHSVSHNDTYEEEGGPAKGCTVSTQSPKDLRTPETLLTLTENNGSNVLKLQRIIEELLSTEREYVKALGYVREHYFPELERADVPQDLRGQRGSIFGNLEKLHDFHRHYFLDELEGCVSEPFRVGRCFLRHRDSFALYALYSKNKPVSDSLLINHGKAFFKQKQVKLDDKMDLWSYLLKPIQRISKYSLLLQDMMKECGPAQARELAEVKAALKVVQFQLRHGNNLLAMDAIHQCDVNLKEQGQLIRQDEFLVTFRKKKCFRHIFLFQELVLFSKTRKTDVGNETYIYKQSFKTSDIGITQNCGDSGLCFEIWFRKRKTQDTYMLQSTNQQMKEAWTKDLEQILWEQAVRNKEVRLQERVFLGIGNKPFMDIQPSEAAINNRAVNYVLIGKEGKMLSSVRSSGSQDALPVVRQKSIGSASSSSSSSSSGRGSLSPVGYLCRAKRGMVEGAMSPRGLLEEDDLDHENGCQNLLLDSSESSGESVSGFSSSCLSYHSTVGAEDASSVCSSTTTLKEADICTEASTEVCNPNAPSGFPENAQPHPKQNQAQNTSAGKSTEV